LDGGRRGGIFRVSASRLLFSVSMAHSPSIPNLIWSLVFARVCLSLAELSIRPSVGIIRNHELSKRISHDAWPVFAALSWASVMWLFRWYPDTLQTGLKSSMDYIYVQSDHWDSLRNFLIYNK
jgi:peroxisomal membrane protein 4